MPGKLLTAALLAAGLLAEDGGKQAIIDLRLDTSGHGQLKVELSGVEGAEQFFAEPVRQALFHGCDKPTLRGNSLGAHCPNLLTPNGPNLTGAIRVDSQFQPLYDLGIDDVIVFVHIPDVAQNPATPETAQWTQVLREGKGIRYGHRAGPRHPLPPALQIEYPARQQSDRWTALAAVCGIIFVPAVFAAIIAGLASSALKRDAQAAIGEEALWLELLTQLVGLFWIGVLGTIDLQDLAFAQFPGESYFGALLAFALIVVPPLLGIVNCIGVWYPILERAGLAGHVSFAETILRAVAQKATLLMPAACLSIALALVPQGLESSLTALIIVAILTLGLAALGSHSAFSGATRVTSGEIYDRAHQLAKRAGVKLRHVWILAERTPPNAFAFSGKQIAIAPAFVRQLTSSQVDAVLAHELGHIRHNDFKIPVLVYSVYLAAAAPLLNHVVGQWMNSAWMLLPQTLLLVLLMGLLTRHAEYRADRMAADLVSPEDTVRALCRLHRLVRHPLTLHPISEVLVSHPSLANRARAIAHHHQQTTDWLRRIFEEQEEPQPTALVS